MGDKIQKITAQEVLNSRGRTTVKVSLETERGVFAASSPSGASTGKHEAVEVKTQTAIFNIEEKIAPELKGKDVEDQKGIDELLIGLDGLGDKSNLGANAILPVSFAVCRAGAASERKPLYNYIKESFQEEANLNISPAFNIINGGVHAGGDLEIQEFMVVPEGESVSEKIKTGSAIYQNLKQLLKEAYGTRAVNIGDEGGFVPPVASSQEALDVIVSSIKRTGAKAAVALDCAASQFYKKGKYYLQGTVFTKEGLLSFYQELLDNYPIISLEDPFAEDDWEGWQMLKDKIGDSCLVIGDDLTVTNTERIKKAKDCCSGLLLKPNQIGTLSEAIEAFDLAKSYNWRVMVSHRSGETCDDFISDLAVGVGADFIKSGAPAGGERVAKYNRLLEIDSL